MRHRANSGERTRLACWFRRLAETNLESVAILFPSGESLLVKNPAENPKPTAPFELRATVQESDIDGLGHVNNTVYLRWVQDVATAHWEALASPEAQEQIVWVVVRHEIDYHIAAMMGDEIVLRTWVGAATRATFERHTQIIRGADAQLLARARTLWCPIDAQTRRPTRVDATTRAQFSTSSP